MAEKEMDVLNERDIDVGEDVIGDKPATLSAPPPASDVVPDYVDWKDVDYLRQFVPERGKIMPRRISGITAKDQRRIAKAIKRPVRWQCCRSSRTRIDVGHVRLRAFQRHEDETES